MYLVMVVSSETFNLRLSGTSQLGQLVVRQFSTLYSAAGLVRVLGYLLLGIDFVLSLLLPLAATEASCSITLISTHSEKSQRHARQIGQFNKQHKTNPHAVCPLNKA